MNSPYMGNFKVTQIQHSSHDGLDLVGVDSKEIHATVNGTVHFAGWENTDNKSQGFGQFVCIKASDGNFYYYGHLSEIKVRIGQIVKITDVIGIEGNTGYSTGSHCHYCCRPKFEKGNALKIYALSGIPNQLGTYNDGYRPDSTRMEYDVELKINGKKYKAILKEEI